MLLIPPGRTQPAVAQPLDLNNADALINQGSYGSSIKPTNQTEPTDEAVQKRVQQLLKKRENRVRANKVIVKKLKTKKARRAPKKVNGVPIYSKAIFVADLIDNKVLLGRNTKLVKPIASLTKLMTAIVVHEAQLDDNEVIVITDEDVDRLKFSRSRLKVGLELTRVDALLLALMSSDNRAANALGRNYPGGIETFVIAMNQKAATLGMENTHFVDPTGLSPENVSTAKDIAILVQAAINIEKIRAFTTAKNASVQIGEQLLKFVNSNPVIKNADSNLDIRISKTGHINEAGFCLAFIAIINNRPITAVIMDAASKSKRTKDLFQIKKYVQKIFTEQQLF